MADRFAGTEPYYADYRPAYPKTVVQDVVELFGLNGTGRVLDLGCGTGRLAVSFGPHAGDVVGMDPNPAMLDHARERAADAEVTNVTFVEGSDADIGQRNLGSLRLTTIGRAFHWMDREHTLTRLYGMTESGGGVVLFGDDEWLTRGTADWQDAAYEVVGSFVDDLPERTGPMAYEETWADVLRASPFSAVETRRYDIVREWSTVEVVGYVLSLSFCTPEAVGDIDAFEQKLRNRLGTGPFVQRATVETNLARR